jgi:formylglycine-generating enzyme required for sulfatase activity
MADIFLSYAREDEARAAVVARVLGELGWSVFWDRRIVAGTSWDEVVERELEACRCVVVLWSAASITSRWVKTEARFALQRSTLVPVNLDRSEPPLEFRFLESAQLHTWQGATNDAEFSVLSDGIAQHVKPVRRESNAEPTAPPAAAPKGKSRSRSGRDGKTKSPPRTDVKTVALLPGTSPTPRPVPFGAPVRFRTDMWSLPDEPLLGFVEIPEGQFTMGSDKRQDPGAEDDELPQHKVDLPRYYIGRYEVTVAQFRAFVQSSGYQANYTTEEDGQADLPVVNVAWHDAVAYATWLDKSLRESRTTPAGVRSILSAGGQSCRVTLPSEAEWEKAARGVDARVYPWGGTFDPAKVNMESSGTGAPTPVGSYPDGASPYGVLDMSGNVWEWTRSLFGTDAYKPDFGYPHDPNDYQREDPKAPDTVWRVVRGGSWHYGARAASRGRLTSDYWSLDVGFRVVVSCSRS